MKTKTWINMLGSALLLLGLTTSGMAQSGPLYSGLRQSPINIVPENTLLCSNLPSITPHYSKGTLTMTQSHGISITVNAGQSTNLLVIGTASRKPGRTYGLKEFHFHSPSEHLQGLGGTDMEMHLVHTNADDSTLLVLGRFIAGGEAENADLAPIFSAFPTSNVPVTVTDFDLTKLLPSPTNLQSFRYDGSLTTGAGEFYQEGVKWIVLWEPLLVSTKQINQYRSLLHESNARTNQPLYGRPVLTDVAVPSLGSYTTPQANANGWQISDVEFEKDGGGTAYAYELNSYQRPAATTNGWSLTVLSSMVAGSKGNGPAQFMNYGNGTSRFDVVWDIDAVGRLTATLGGVTNVLTTGPNATNCHSHMVVYNPAANKTQAAYYFDGTFVTNWVASADPNQNALVQWGGTSSKGTGTMNYYQVQFAIRGLGIVANYFGGFTLPANRQQWPDPTNQVWTATTQGTAATVRTVSDAQLPWCTLMR